MAGKTPFFHYIQFKPLYRQMNLWPTPLRLKGGQTQPCTKPEDGSKWKCHCEAFVVICSYSWGWRKPEKTNTSVVPLCYIKLLLSGSEDRTRSTGARGLSCLNVRSWETKLKTGDWSWRFLQQIPLVNKSFITEDAQ